MFYFTFFYFGIKCFYFIFIIMCIEAKMMLFLFPGKSLSMGYGFVQYHKAEAAQKALRQLQVHLYFFIKTFSMVACCFLANASSFPRSSYLSIVV